jgi:dihydroxyacetone kinase-like protein
VPATRTLIDHVDELTELDSGHRRRRSRVEHEARRGWRSRARLDDWRASSLNEALKAAGTTCMATIGGSSGPVFGTLLVTLAKELPAEPKPADLGAAIAAAIAALTRLGKAEVGQKTLLDVLDPVQRVLATGPAPISSRACASARSTSAAATATMAASRGRASFLGERALGHVDPGSRSMAFDHRRDLRQSPAARFS